MRASGFRLARRFRWARYGFLLTAPLLAVSISSLLLQAQCPQRSAASPPLGEVLKSLATACSHASLSDASCPVNHQAAETTAYAMFKDCADTKPDAYLVVPTAPVTGVEDTKLRSDAYSRLLADAWEWGKRFPKADAAWTGLAINSACARDIDQLHVHVSCVSHAVKEALEKERESIPLYKDGEHPESREITVAMSNPSGTDSGQARYFAVRVTDLGKQNPVVIADKLTRHATPAACVQNPKRGEVVKEDVAVVGSPVQDEYFVLTYASGFGEGGAEDLLDQTCKQAEHKGGRN